MPHPLDISNSSSEHRLRLLEPSNRFLCISQRPSCEYSCDFLIRNGRVLKVLREIGNQPEPFFYQFADFFSAYSDISDFDAEKIPEGVLRLIFVPCPKHIGKPQSIFYVPHSEIVRLLGELSQKVPSNGIGVYPGSSKDVAIVMAFRSDDVLRSRQRLFNNILSPYERTINDWELDSSLDDLKSIVNRISTGRFLIHGTRVELLRSRDAISDFYEMLIPTIEMLTETLNRRTDQKAESFLDVSITELFQPWTGSLRGAERIQAQLERLFSNSCSNPGESCVEVDSRTCLLVKYMVQKGLERVGYQIAPVLEDIGDRLVLKKQKPQLKSPMLELKLESQEQKIDASQNATNSIVDEPPIVVHYRSMIDELSSKLETLKLENERLRGRPEEHDGTPSKNTSQRITMRVGRVDFNRGEASFDFRCSLSTLLATHFRERAVTDPSIGSIDGRLLVCSDVDSELFPIDSLYRDAFQRLIDSFLHRCLHAPLKLYCFRTELDNHRLSEGITVSGHFIPASVLRGTEAESSQFDFLDSIGQIRHSPYREQWLEQDMERWMGHSERVRQIIDLLESKPSEDFELATKDLQLLLDSVRAEIAERLTPLINAKLQAMPSHEYEDKKEICKWLTSTLRPLFLAIKSKNGLPSLLAASGDSGNGVFRFSESSESGPKRYVGSSVSLPELELTPALPRAESLLRNRE